MRPVVRSLLVLLLPAVVVGLVYATLIDLGIELQLLILLYLLSVVWTVLYYRKNLSRPAFLPLSFLATLIGPYIVDTLKPGMFQYIGTAAVIIFYAAPCTLITLVTSIVLLIRERKRQKPKESA